MTETETIYPAISVCSSYLVGERERQDDFPYETLAIKDELKGYLIEASYSVLRDKRQEEVLRTVIKCERFFSRAQRFFFSEKNLSEPDASNIGLHLSFYPFSNNLGPIMKCVTVDPAGKALTNFGGKERVLVTN